MSLHEQFQALQRHVSASILGQDELVRRLLVALLAGGHLLVEGMPGLAKTSAVKTLASGLEGNFHRVQFTPDLLPADLTGTDILNPRDGSFAFQPGPIFHNFVLADEVNRAPAKVQSALLEAMGEGQVTVGRVTHQLPPLFLVMATQNPIDQAGTYPLPEAQRDRFLLHVRVDYPSADTERDILRLVRARLAGGGEEAAPAAPVLSQEAVFAARRAVLALHMAPEVEAYIVRLVEASRRPQAYGDDLASWIAYGASPRGSIALDLAARALAWLDGRDWVSPEDVQAVAPDALRHRILLSYDAEADGVTVDEVVRRLLGAVAVP